MRGMTNSATFDGSVIPTFDSRAETKSDECSDATTVDEVSDEEDNERITIRIINKQKEL
jgi:hypothetical protein